MEIGIAQAAQNALSAEVDRCAAVIQAIPGVNDGPMGLTPDAIKFSPEFIAAKANFEKAKSALRAFDKLLGKAMLKKMAQARMAKRLAALKN
jgi:hypothetical protein